MIKKKKKKKKDAQKEFPFVSSRRESFLSDPPRLRDLGKLPVTVLQISTRGRKWLRAHKITDLDQLIEASRKKLISQQCLDNQVRKELHRELGNYCAGKKYKYIFALNFLGRGVEKILGQRKLRSTPVSRLEISAPLQEVLREKGINTVGEILLQPELEWRNPRKLGNIMVDEILVALASFIVQHKKK